jgi:hypothetical protein
MQVYELLEKFRNKGACNHTQYVANKLLNELKTHLHDDRWFKLYTSHMHYLLGEGASEFFETVNCLKSRYENKI